MEDRVQTRQVSILSCLIKRLPPQQLFQILIQWLVQGAQLLLDELGEKGEAKQLHRQIAVDPLQ